MRDYVLYHNATKMRYDLENLPVDCGDSDEDDDINIFGQQRYVKPEPEWDYFAGEEKSGDYAFSIVTSNKNETRESIGHRVWVIQGRGCSSPREYYLHGFFYPHRAEKCLIEIGGQKFKYQLHGYDSEIIRPIFKAAYLDRFGWFGGMLGYYKNFRTGFREIKDSAWVAHLEEIYDHTLKQ